jgi:SPP1 family predicted phage head-tail adaptor
MKTGAGILDKKLRFERRAPANDPQGNTEGDWVPVLTRRARVKPLAPNETVIASRLQGVTPFEVTVRSDSDTRSISEAWRAVNVHTGEAYNIGPVVNPDERNRYLIFTCTRGSANG